MLHSSSSFLSYINLDCNYILLLVCPQLSQWDPLTLLPGSHTLQHFLGRTPIMVWSHSHTIKRSSVSYIMADLSCLTLLFLPQFTEFDDLPLSVSKTDMATIVKVMQLPDSGLEIRDRMWLKITIANAVIGLCYSLLWLYIANIWYNQCM